MVVADAQVWFFMWQDNWTTVITTKKLWKNYYNYLYFHILPSPRLTSNTTLKTGNNGKKRSFHEQ
jgi:hypothetical protein